MVLKQNHECGFIVLALALLLASCSTTKVVKHGEPFEHEGAATLVTRDGMAQKISSVRLVGDSLVVAFHHLERRIPTDQAVRIEYVSRGRGVARGLLYGSLIGAGIGMVVGATPAGECKEAGCIIGGSGGWGAVGFLAGMIQGALVGGQVGVKVSVLFDSAAYVPPNPEALGRKDGFNQPGTDF